MIKTHKNFNKGFTLIEMIVSLGVFTFVVLIALGSFLAILGAQKKAIAVGTLQENLRYSIETMLKEIRMGYNYYCGDFENNFGQPGQSRDCNNGGKTITFITRNDDIIIYRSNNNRIEKYKKDIASFSTVDESEFNPITFEEVNIENLKFFVTGSETIGNTDQPKVTLVITGTMGIKSKPSFSKFNIQTTVSQRLPDRE